MTPGKALAIMKKAHEGQLDKSGQPYWTHPVRVTESLGFVPPFVEVASLLHDVLEDTDVTPQMLIEQGIKPRSMEILLLLTRQADESYDQFIRRIASSGNEWAIRIKLADNADNTSRPLPPEHMGLHKRYRKARAILLEALENLGGQ